MNDAGRSDTCQAALKLDRKPHFDSGFPAECCHTLCAPTVHDTFYAPERYTGAQGNGDALDDLADHTSALDDLAAQAELSAWMLANRSTVYELSSDDDSRVCALADAALNARPAAPRYTLDATARAVLAMPVDVANG